MVVFDHINKKVVQVSTAPDKKVKELLAAQREQVATASGMPRK
jgi:hypothetical protein